jgi:hypothetical protein
MRAAPGRAITVDELDELVAVIRHRHRAHLRELRIDATDGGLILSGRARSYYGKQMAQEEVLQRGLAIVANELTVAQFVVARPVPEFADSRPSCEPERNSMTSFVPPHAFSAVEVAEVVGISLESWRDAVWKAVSSVLIPSRALVGMEVIQSETSHTDRPRFRVTVKLAYAIRAKPSTRPRRALVTA